MPRTQDRILSIAAILAFMAVAGYAFVSQKVVPRVKTTPQSVAQYASPRVMALGRLEPFSEVVRIAAPAAQDAGRLAEILVGEGDWVEAGQPIAYLDTRARLNAALLQAEATLSIRQAALAKTIADLESQEKTLNAALEQQKAQRERTRWEYDRLAQLQKAGMYNDTVLIDKKLALQSANYAFDSALLLLERNRRRDSLGTRIDEAAARTDVDAAQAGLVRAKADLEFSVMRSPLTGRLLKLIGRAGEQIGQDGFAEIGDTRTMMVRAEVFESDLRRVVVGGAVIVTSRALAEGLSGSVDRIGLKVNRQTMFGEDPATSLDARVIEVMIRLDASSSERAARLTGLQVRVVFSSETAP